MSQSALERVPKEVYDLVCESTPSTADLKTLRATCKSLHQQTEKVWTKRTFAHFHVTLDRSSLEYLEQVSESEKYAKCVQTITVEAGIFQYKGPARWYGNVVQSTSELMTNRDCTAALRRALLRLPRIESVELAPWTKPDRKARGGRAAPQVLEPFPGDSRWVKVLSDAFQIILKAMEVGVVMRQLKGGCVPVGQLRNSVLLPREISRELSNSLMHLERLHLVLEGGNSISTVELSRFLGKCTNLKSLRLEFWAFNQQCLTATLRDVDFPHLQSLHLEVARRVFGVSLRNFVQRHKETLKDLALVLLEFQNEDLATIFPTMFEGLRLHSLRLQQIVSEREGLLLFGTNLEKTCETCKADLLALWRFEHGPGCQHATIDAKGEADVKEQLDSRMEVVALPWPPARVNWPWIDGTPRPQTAEQEEQKDQEKQKSQKGQEGQDESVLATIQNNVQPVSSEGTGLAAVQPTDQDAAYNLPPITFEPLLPSSFGPPLYGGLVPSQLGPPYMSDLSSSYSCFRTSLSSTAPPSGGVDQARAWQEEVTVNDPQLGSFSPAPEEANEDGELHTASKKVRTENIAPHHGHDHLRRPEPDDNPLFDPPAYDPSSTVLPSFSNKSESKKCMKPHPLRAPSGNVGAMGLHLRPQLDGDNLTTTGSTPDTHETGAQPQAPSSARSSSI